jgi:phenylalanyl-tRNA synthetase beta chain
MWELGQPLHAFDLNLLEGQKIVVKRAGRTATFVTLDEKVRRLHEDMLLIWDGEKPVAIAGIMGGLNSEVYEDTEDILLESAYFQPMSVRKTSKALGLFSEASRRFEKGVDPQASLRIAKRASQLMCEISGGTLLKGAIDACPLPIQPPKITLRVDRANRYIGKTISPNQMQKIFSGLGFHIAQSTRKTITVSPPARRLEDITREVDLIEEVARIVGYDNIPTTLPKTRTVSSTPDKESRVEEVIRTLLAGSGHSEVITYSFISPNSFDQLLLPQHDFRRNAVRLMNPLGEEQSILRTTLLPGLLSVAEWNIRHNNLGLRLFEVGKVFHPREGEELPEERPSLSALVMGDRFTDSWCLPKDRVDFFDLKGSIEDLFQRFGVEDCEFVPTDEIPFYETGQGCLIKTGSNTLGSLGGLSREVLENFDLDMACYVSEITLDRLFEIANVGRRFAEISKFPPVYRDLSIVLDLSVVSSEVLKLIRSMGISLIQQAYVFDHYKGKQVPEGKQVLGFRICYQSMERNLTDSEVNQQHEGVIGKVTEKFDAKLR